LLLAIGAEAASLGGNCVAYARQTSGISLDGNAGSWWSQAEGRYERGQAPAVGAVLIFKPSGHMRVGHVAVVSQIVKAREILVDQANWIRGRVVKGMSVIDASPNNDWTVVKVVELHSGTHGRENLTYGFVYPRKPRPSVSDTLLADSNKEKSSAKLPVQLVAARGNDGPVEVAKPPAEKVPAVKPHEAMTPMDNQKLPRSAAVQAAGRHADAAKPSAAKPPKDHPKERGTASQKSRQLQTASKASVEKHASSRPGRAPTATKKATKSKTAA